MVHVRHVFVRTESTSNSMKKTEMDRYLHRLHTYRDDSFNEVYLWLCAQKNKEMSY